MENTTIEFGIFGIDRIYEKYDKRCKEVEDIIDKLDELYRGGKPVIPDSKFDEIVDYYGYKPTFYEGQLNFSRKTKVPVNIGSMEKLKTTAELHKWLENTNAVDTDIVVISGKYDGVSIISDNKPTPSAWSSGKDGTGLDVSKHYVLFKNEMGLAIQPNWYVKGELIMNTEIFNKKYSKVVDVDGFENARNMISGKVTDKEPSTILEDATHICYSIIDSDNEEPLDKISQLALLNCVNTDKARFMHLPVSVLKEYDDEQYIQIFKNFCDDGFELDGLIIEYNSIEKRKELGYETNSFNPKYARAFKHEEFEEKAETKILEIVRQLSKDGTSVPVAIIEPIRLNGATINRTYLDNERFLAEFGVGVGSKVVVRRSGMVIPRIVQVEHIKIPPRKELEKLRNMITSSDKNLAMRVYFGLNDKSKYAPFDTNLYKWDENGVNCMLIEHNDIVAKQKLVAFFETVGAFGVSDGIIDQFFANGYTTLEKILSLSPQDLQFLDGWNEKKANNVCSSIKQSITGISLEMARHASGLFEGLGSKKLVLLSHFKTKPTIEQVKQLKDSQM